MLRTGSLGDLATAIDSALQAPVLVTGTLPPEAEDLDLIARPAEYGLLTEFLDGEGFIPWRRTWLRLEPDAAQVVELTRADGWGPRRDHDGEDLFTDYVPVEGHRHVVRPGPATQLVLVANSLLVRRGALPPSKRRRAEEAVSVAGDVVWDEAAEIAARLHLLGPLQALRRLLGRDSWTAGQRAAQMAWALAGSPVSAILPVARQLTPRRVRPVLVSLSGPDGSGKSTQAALLTEALRAVGVDAASAWAPTTQRPSLPKAVRALSERWRREPTAVSGTHTSEPAPQGTPRRERSGQLKAPLARIAEHLWIASAALSNARAMWQPVWHHRARSVLVLDRFTVDADAKLIYWYRHRRAVDIEPERRLLTVLAPAADVTVLLRVTPETNHARRRDEFDLDEFRAFWRIYDEIAPAVGAAVVDAGRSVSDVSSDVLRVVWQRLP